MQIQLEEYNKLSQLQNLSSPQVLSQINILDKFDYAKDVASFNALNKDKHAQIYITSIQPRNNIQKTSHLKDCPKILLLKSDPESLIIQQGVSQRLNELLVFNQSLPYCYPYLQEQRARKIIHQLLISTNDYRDYGLNYDCISLKNAVVAKNQKWQFSVVGYIFQIDKNNAQFYRNNGKNNESQLSFAFGCLFFKLLFGFSPFSPDQKNWDRFQFLNFLNILQTSLSHKLLKIYHFCERISEISPECKQLLQYALTGKGNLDYWLNNPYFNQELIIKQKLDSKKKQILMIKQAEPRYASLIISAIDYRKKHQFQKLNSKSPLSVNESTISELTQRYNWFNYLQISDKLTHSGMKVNQVEQKQRSVLSINYFNQQIFDFQTDFPIQQLIRFIDKQRQKQPAKFKNQKYQYKLKLYAYPYATAFQLLKIQHNQSPQIKKKIRIAFDLLMQISAMNEIDPRFKLHNTQLKCKNFQQIKPLYRQTINDLYQFCLNQAMRKYNIKNDVNTQIKREERKKQGLQYYRLCLVLLQASLIVRKGGADLNLNRIQTASRKQIQEDLNILLQKYFPKKPQFH